MKRSHITKALLLVTCSFGGLATNANAQSMQSAGFSIVGLNTPKPEVTPIPEKSQPAPRVEQVISPPPIAQAPVQSSMSVADEESVLRPGNGVVAGEPVISPGDPGAPAASNTNQMPADMVAPVYISPRERRRELQKEKHEAVNPVSIPARNMTPAPEMPSNPGVAEPVVPNKGDSVRIWHVMAGHTVNDILMDWADKSGWTVAFKTNQVYEIEASADFQGDFVGAATALLKSVHAEPQFKAVFHSGNKVLVVGNTFQQVE